MCAEAALPSEPRDTTLVTLLQTLDKNDEEQRRVVKSLAESIHHRRSDCCKTEKIGRQLEVAMAIINAWQDKSALLISNHQEQQEYRDEILERIKRGFSSCLQQREEEERVDCGALVPFKEGQVALFQAAQQSDLHIVPLKSLFGTAEACFTKLKEILPKLAMKDTVSFKMSSEDIRREEKNLRSYFLEIRDTLHAVLEENHQLRDESLGLVALKDLWIDAMWEIVRHFETEDALYQREDLTLIEEKHSMFLTQVQLLLAVLTKTAKDSRRATQPMLEDVDAPQEGTCSGKDGFAECVLEQAKILNQVVVLNLLQCMQLIGGLVEIRYQTNRRRLSRVVEGIHYAESHMDEAFCQLQREKKSPFTLRSSALTKETPTNKALAAATEMVKTYQLPEVLPNNPEESQELIRVSIFHMVKQVLKDRRQTAEALKNIPQTSARGVVSFRMLCCITYINLALLFACIQEHGRRQRQEEGDHLPPVDDLMRQLLHNDKLLAVAKKCHEVQAEKS